MEGWTDMMYILMDAVNPHFVKFYFISCVIVCSFFLLNLTVAVMLMEYEELDKTDQNGTHKIQLQVMGTQSVLPPPLINFIIQQNSITISKKANKLLKQNDQTLWQKIIFSPPVPDPRYNPYYRSAIPRWFY